MVSEKMKQLGTARSVIRELFEYGNQRAAVVGRENVFDFSLGNPSVAPPHEVTETALRLLRTEEATVLHGYTSAQGDTGVGKALAEDLNRRFDACVGAADLYVSVGAAAALCCVFHGLTCPGDEFVIVAPYFPEYRVFIQGSGAAMKVILPNPDTLQIDPAALEAALTPHTKGVVVNSPNNPSGVVYTEDTLRAAAAVLERKSREYGHPIYLISDEPYREIVFEGHTVPWIPHLYRDTIVCYSFSKSLSLPGERVGYALVPPSVSDHDDVYAAIAGAGRMLGYVNAPSLFQRVVSSCCHLTADTSVYAKNAALLVSSLREMGYECVEPQGAFYLFLKTPEEDDMAFSERAKGLDLLLVPGSGFGMPGYVRLAFCVQTEMIRRALPKFSQLMESYK